MKIKTYFQLARISNLPTVWTNVFTGVVLANGQWQDLRLIYLLAAMSLFYVAGMFLNDAFDHKFDAQMRQDRPIPRG
ncbi:MAG: UbiA family prenyltransferase, partial [Methylotenera sp.]